MQDRERTPLRPGFFPGLSRPLTASPVSCVLMSATEKEEEEEGAGEDRAGEGIRVWCEEARLRIALYYYIQEEEGRKKHAKVFDRESLPTAAGGRRERAASSSSSSSSSSAASFSTSLHSLRGLYRQLATEEGDGGGERASFTPSSSPKRTFSLSFPPFGPLPLTASFFSLSLPSPPLLFWVSGLGLSPLPPLIREGSKSL